MKLKCLWGLAVVIMASSCQQMSEIATEGKNKTISFEVDFDIEKNAISRGALEDYVNFLQVYDYKNGVLANELTQSKEDEGFGVITLNADYGTHELVFVGHNSTTCNYDYDKSELSFDKVMDTFTAFQTLDVDIDTEESQSVKLERQIAGIKLVMEDAVPQNAAAIELTVNGYSSALDPKTGKGSTGTEHVRRWEYSAANIGKKATSYTLYTFLPEEDHLVNITIRLEDNDGNDIVNYTLNDIPVEKNKMTVISGNLLSTCVSTSIVIDGEWDDEIKIKI